MAKRVAVGGTVYFTFPTQSLAGVKTTLSGSPAISAYKNGSTTQSTAGISLTVDYDSVTGLNHIAVDTSADGTFYADGSEIELIITAGTVDSISVVGETVASFVMGPQPANVTAMAANVLNASALASDAVTAIQSGLATAAALTVIAGYLDTEIQAILDRMGAFSGIGVNNILGFLRAIMRSDASVPSDVGGTFTSSTDSLEAIAEDLETIAPAELVVAATSAVLTAIDEGGNVEIRRGDRASFGFTGLGNLAGRSGEKLFFTVKSRKTNDLDDANAIVQLTETSGLVLVNGEAPDDSTYGSLTVTDEVAGDLTIVLKSGVTNDLEVGSERFYDIQMIRSDGEPVTLCEGYFTVVADVTRRETV